MKKAILILILMIVAVSVTKADVTSSCYQEFANETPCYNSQAGSYQCFGNFAQPCANAYDGIWTTTKSAMALSPSNIKIQINYYLPLDRIILNAKWQVRFLNKSLANPYYNFTLPSGCLNNSYANVFTEVNGTMIYFSCHDYTNNTDFIFYNESGVVLNSRKIFEEGMNWNLLCVNSWSCNGYDSCMPDNTQSCNSVIDLNNCGDSYSGDYSEFSQPCTAQVKKTRNNNNAYIVQQNLQKQAEATQSTTCKDIFCALVQVIHNIRKALGLEK